ncbi:MAG: hypothetical protein LC659_02195, partial [Myxococcales bacterium]|nr:hypothetical protein [Myxococcales bacterium]
MATAPSAAPVAGGDLEPLDGGAIARAVDGDLARADRDEQRAIERRRARRLIVDEHVAGAAVGGEQDAPDAAAQHLDGVLDLAAMRRVRPRLGEVALHALERAGVVEQLIFGLPDV